MSQERGSAHVGATAVVMIVTMAIVFQCDVAEAVTYTVGDNVGGWTFNVNSWSNGKTFRTGDILVFNYPAGAHNVVGVDEAGYDGCNTNGAKFTKTSGNDKITLDTKGMNYFICSFPGHCQSGMKIAVNVI